jgi:menaquinol-cytochrome c reductase iron-sulfur subunit
MEECKCQCAAAGPDRRSFMKKVASGVLGALALLGPVGAAIAFMFDPLRRKADGAGITVPVTTLDSLPEDGMPRKFPIIASRVDAWNKAPASPIGAVYLRRLPGKPIQALNVSCPHAGCFVDYAPNINGYFCPCHDSAFDLDGSIKGKSPSPRPLDQLTVEVRNENEVWVKFQNFRAGVAEKIPA